jgi:hypothetical protein
MKNFAFMTMLAFSTIAGAAKFTEIESSKLKSEALKSIAEKSAALIKTSPLSNADTIQYHVTIKSIEPKAGQEEEKMIRQFLHVDAGFETVQLDAEKLTGLVPAKTFEIVFFSPYTVSAETNLEKLKTYVAEVTKVSKELEDLIKKETTLIVYTGSYSGEGAHEQASSGFLIYDPKTNELIFVSLTLSV